jgi:hypothetical protein
VGKEIGVIDCSIKHALGAAGGRSRVSGNDDFVIATHAMTRVVFH